MQQTNEMKQQSILLGALDSTSLMTHAPAVKCTQQKSNKSIIETLKEDKRFSKLVSALSQSKNLTDDLTSGRDITFFAPTNQAFESIERDMHGKKDELDSILRYHCIAKRACYQDLADGQTLETKLKSKHLNDQHQRIRVFKCSHTGTVSLNMFSRIQEFDMEATNGIVHVVDRVILPPSNIYQVLNYLPTKFSIWLLAVERTDMQRTLREQSGLTCFIPTNAAWMNLGYAALAHLFSETGKKDLMRIVEFHLSSKLVYADKLISEKHVQLETLLKGDKIEVNVEEMKRGERSIMNFGWEKQDKMKHHDGGINPNCNRILLNRGESRVVFTDAVCENGNMFIISHVMVPDGVCVDGQADQTGR